jgi:hypothetical protein
MKAECQSRTNNKRLSKRILLILFFVLSGAIIAVANAEDIVVPNANLGTEGNRENCIPLTGCLDADRYQQVFGSSQFTHCWQDHGI